MEKIEVRQRMKEARRKMPAQAHVSLSLRLSEWLSFVWELRRADTVMLYLPLPGEADVSFLLPELWDAGVRVAVPYCLPEEEGEMRAVLLTEEMWGRLEKDRYGVRQPAAADRQFIPEEEIDVLIAPGLAFDYQGWRLGFGAGYYDRFCRRLRPDAVKIGACYEFQLQGALARDEFDVPVDLVVTESRAYRRGDYVPFLG